MIDGLRCWRLGVCAVRSTGETPASEQPEKWAALCRLRRRRRQPDRQDIHQHCGGSNNNAMSTNPLGMNNSTGEASVKAAAGEENAHGPANASSSSSDNSRQQQSNEVRRPLRNQSTTG